MVVDSDTDHPGRFAPGAEVDAGGATLTVASSQATAKGLLVRFEGVADRNAAEGLRGLRLTIADSERRQLEADEFWPDQLLGLEARTPDGSVIGRVTEVIEGVGQHRLSLSTDSGPREIPFVAELVPIVDVAHGYLVVATIEGLI